MSRAPHPTVLVIALILALVVAGCGDSSDSEADSTTTTTASPNPADDANADSDDGEPGSDGTGATEAVVEIDGDTYEFHPEMLGSCLIDENGIFRASIVNDDFTSLEVSLPPEGYVAESPLFAADEYPSVVLVLPDAAEWSADAYESDPQSVNNRNIPQGQTQVDSYEFDGASASGTATFLNMEDLTYDQDDGSYSGQPASGSFEVSCG